ncbi:hypothetical protein KEM56_000334 [Ascosphaera pollenicola]|nr:hypothetical protein KEM56_000334 [Ascosphaera pollenicola]
MKFSAVLAAAVAGASAETVSLMALRSASPIHFQALHAYQEGIWIGQPTQSYCPAQVSGCRTVNETTFGVADGSTALNVEVPGGQQLYVSADGALKYTVPHSASIGDGSHAAALKIEALNDSVDKATLDGDDFLACPGKKGEEKYQVFSAAAKNVKPPTGDKGDCLGFTAVAGKVDAEKFRAWEFN